MGVFTVSVGTWIRLNTSGANESTVRGTDYASSCDGLSETVKDFCFYFCFYSFAEALPDGRPRGLLRI